MSRFHHRAQVTEQFIRQKACIMFAMLVSGQSLTAIQRKDYVMTYQIIIGVDVSKDTFNITVIDGKTGKKITPGVYKNIPKAIKRFMKDHCDKSVLIVMEATGNYHLKLSSLLSKNQIAHSIVNPLVIKRFCQMKLSRAKNDKSDSFLIAQYGREQNPALYEPPSKEQQQIKSLTTVINNLTKQRTQLKNLLQSQELVPDQEAASIKSIKSIISHMDKQIEKLESKRQKLIKDHFPHEYQPMISVMGVGEKTTAATIAYVGDFSKFENSKQVVA